MFEISNLLESFNIYLLKGVIMRRFSVPTLLVLAPLSSNALLLSDDKTKTFFHGNSYTANAIACSAACASMDLMEQESTFAAIKMI